MDANVFWELLGLPAADDVLVATSGEDVLLEDAHLFIGDLDFDVDATINKHDEPPRLLWEEVPEAVFAPRVLPTMSIVPSVIHGSEMLLKSAHLTPIRPARVELPAHLGPSRKSIPVNKTRTRRREELIYLRGLVGDLEQRLTGLRASPRPVTPEPPVGNTGESSELMTAWQEVAERQAKQREAAEMQNIKLKRLLEDQIEVVKSLERLMLKKRPCLEAAKEDTEFSKKLRRTNSRSWNRALIFDELLVNCAAYYTQVAHIEAQFKNYSLLTNHRDVGVVHDPVLGLTLQTKEFRVLPFDYQDTADEIWSYLPTASTVHRIHEYHDVAMTDDTLKFQFRVKPEANGTHGDFAVKMATRRYVEANRTVIVMSGILESGEISDVEMDSVRVRLTAWHIIEPIVADASCGHSAATKVYSHLISVPEVDADQRDRARKVGTLTDFMLAVISAEIESRSQHLEDRLLQRSFERKTLG